MREKLKSAYGRVRRVYADLAAHKYTTVAGALAFFLFGSVMPFLFWLTLLFGRITAAEEIARLSIFGWAKEFLLSMQSNAEGAGEGAGILFLVTTLWSSSAFFYHLRRSGELVYDAPHRHGWKVRLGALIMTFAVLLYLAGAGAALVTVAVVVRNLTPLLRFPIIYSALFLLGFFAAWLLNIYVCPYRARASRMAGGSLLTALLWLFAAAAFSVYLRFSDRERLYGALSLVVVFNLFLYWMSICYVTGMVYTRRCMQRAGALQEDVRRRHTPALS